MKTKIVNAMKISFFKTGGLIALSKKKDASRVSSLKEQLRKGYTEMAELNKELAEEGLASDNEALAGSEEKLLESE